jgi:hypothetical protein
MKTQTERMHNLATKLAEHAKGIMKNHYPDYSEARLLKFKKKTYKGLMSTFKLNPPDSE